MTSISNAAENLLTLVSDVLDFSKIEAGKVELEHSTFGLREELEVDVYAVLDHMTAFADRVRSGAVGRGAGDDSVFCCGTERRSCKRASQ